MPFSEQYSRRRPAFVRLVWLGFASLTLTGCVHAPKNLVMTKAPVAGAGVVFAADGAGNFRAASENVREVVVKDGVPVEVVTFNWSHGYGRILADQVSYSHARAEGYKLARLVEEFRHEHPETPVHLLGHSAGAAVVLAALENLPPQSVNRAFLLAPSMSAYYDLCSALQAVQSGLYVYYSHRDYLYLGVAIGILGNSDRRWGPSSGRTGFQVPACGPEGAALFAKLYQRPWQPTDHSTGNHGGHYGNYQAGFVRGHIVPLLLAP